MSKFYTDPSTGQRLKIEKTHKFRNFVVFPFAGLIALGVIVTAANGSGSAPPVPATDSTTTTTKGVSTLDVAGEGQASVGIMSGGQSINTVTLPDHRELPDGLVTVTVSRVPSVESYQNGGDQGTISCTITRDGKVVDTQTASGQFAAVSCTKSY